MIYLMDLKGFSMISPRGGGVRAFAAAESATPVQPGEIRVEASVLVRYLLGE